MWVNSASDSSSSESSGGEFLSGPEGARVARYHGDASAARTWGGDSPPSSSLLRTPGVLAVAALLLALRHLEADSLEAECSDSA